ncbi:MAG: insulinase family protein [Candidatus Tectomicrobia bacterium]|nr:insulinase family protein [Candidatus Tectomicrobia bacterium]
MDRADRLAVHPRRGGVRLLTLLLLAVLAGLSGGMPAAASSHEGKLRLEVRRFQLDNGLEGLVLEDHSAPLVAVQLWYRAGSRNERPGMTGISHFLEHMMFKGTTTTAANEFSRLVQRLGGTENAFTSNDMTVYFSTVPADKLEVVLRHEADRMLNLTLPAKEIVPERKVVMEERRLGENTPQRRLFEELEAVAFKVHPYRWPVVGWMEDLENISRDELLRYYRTYYRPDNARLVVVGDTTLETVRGLAQRHFGSISGKGSDRPASPAAARGREPEQLGERRLEVNLQASLPVVAMAYQAPPANHPDSVALDLLAAVLGSGESSRLHRGLVYEQQVATSADADADLKLDAGLFTISASVQAGHSAAEVERRIEAEITRLQEELVSEREIQKAKNNVMSSFIFRQQGVMSQAMTIGFFTFYRPLEQLNTYLDMVQAVQPEALREVARRILQKRFRTVAVLVPKADEANQGTQAAPKPAAPSHP